MVSQAVWETGITAELLSSVHERMAEHSFWRDGGGCRVLALVVTRRAVQREAHCCVRRSHFRRWVLRMAWRSRAADAKVGG